MQPDANIRSLLRSLTGQEISTVTGRPNRVLRLDGDDVIVATERSPAGTAVSIQMVQSGLDRLRVPDAAELEVSVASLGHRSSFVGAVLLTLPGTRFLSFMENFLPGPPDERPKWDKVDWACMTDYLRMIYNYRSRALHAGTPFPEPMCEVPHVFDDGVPIERPIGHATGVPEASWLAEDTPMLLSTFEYIVRSALLRWWSELSPEASQSSRL